QPAAISQVGADRIIAIKNARGKARGDDTRRGYAADDHGRAHGARRHERRRVAAAAKPAEPLHAEAIRRAIAAAIAEARIAAVAAVVVAAASILTAAAGSGREVVGLQQLAGRFRFFGDVESV